MECLSHSTQNRRTEPPTIQSTDYLYLGGGGGGVLFPRLYVNKGTGSPGLPVSQHFSVKKESGKRNLGWGGVGVVIVLWLNPTSDLYLQWACLRLRVYYKFRKACRWICIFFFKKKNHTAVIYFHVYLRFWDLYVWDDTSAKTAIRFAMRTWVLMPRLRVEGWLVSRWSCLSWNCFCSPLDPLIHLSQQLNENSEARRMLKSRILWTFQTC